ncbi:LuxR C-terminal-related transcriptional regulator [Microbacterium sp. CR_7]|uniref:helix-turn-helix transcriptional regulator n=1 Tax=Microbacterium sp. CR_7 TaxID=3055792 RepID=UPI0035C1E04A
MGGEDESSALGRITQARKDEEWDQVLALLRDHWSELVQDDPHALLDIIGSLSAPVLEQNPRLRLADQHLRRTLRRDPEPRAYRDILTDDPDAAPLDRLAALTGRIAAARAAGRHRDAVDATDRAVAALRELPVEVIPSFGNALPEFHYHWGVTYLLVSRFADAMEQFTRSHDWAVTVDNRMVSTRAGGAIALVHALHGRGRDAKTWLSKLPSVPDEAWWAADARTAATIAEAIVLIEQLQLDAARSLLAGIQIASSPDLLGPYFAVRAFIIDDDRAEAQSLLSEFDSFVEGLAPEYAEVPLNAEYSALVRYLLLQVLHQPERAVRALGPTKVGVEASVVQQVGVTLHALRMVKLGQVTAARKIVAPLLHVSSARPRVLLPALVIAAASDAVDQQQELLRRAVGLASWNGCYAALAFAPVEQRVALAELLRECEGDEIADRLLAIEESTAIAGSDTLTRREAAVVEAALSGLSNVEISELQHVSVNTVKTHIRIAYRKLGVSNRTQLLQLYQLGR